ncbi:hypothetical protein XENTR_v10020946 [Xenopus tropicalis]|nr:hypothetical protein XENTR_v10020946 [Xenopus tropicalis]
MGKRSAARLAARPAALLYCCYLSLPGYNRITLQSPAPITFYSWEPAAFCTGQMNRSLTLCGPGNATATQKKMLKKKSEAACSYLKINHLYLSVTHTYTVGKHTYT